MVEWNGKIKKWRADSKYIVELKKKKKRKAACGEERAKMSWKKNDLSMYKRFSTLLQAQLSIKSYDSYPKGRAIYTPSHCQRI